MPDAARLIVDAFQHEAITAYWLNLSGEIARQHYAKLIEAKLRLYLLTGQPLLAAVAGDKVVGVAVIKLKRSAPPIGQTLKIVLPIVPRLLALAPRVRVQALHALSLGIAAMKPPASLPKPYQLLEAIAVHPDHQGQGIGSLLLKAVHELAKQNELPTYLMTGDANNRQIYEHVGYRTVACKQAPGLAVCHMVRP
ncbi:MAG: GNAT family N-acetyltransferase [Truepera sp.]|nr:GNAT family N-acetyltransferase [Truepera sp.]